MPWLCPSVNVRFNDRKPSFNGQHETGVDGYITKAEENTSIPDSAAEEGGRDCAHRHFRKVEIATEYKEHRSDGVRDSQTADENVIRLLEGVTFRYHDTNDQHVPEE